MFFFFFCVTAIILFGILIVTAFLAYLVRHSNRSPKNVAKKEKVSFCAVLGSGGHTTEMLELISEFGEEYSDRTYVIADTDIISENKVKVLEATRKNGEYRIEQIPRSREVGQSYITSIFSTIYSTYFSFQLVYKIRPDLVLLNGPGTCIPIAFASAFFDLIRLFDTVMIYEESICRVKKLSLSGSILYYSGLVDVVLVQWAELKQKYPRVTFIGDLPDPDILEQESSLELKKDV